MKYLRIPILLPLLGACLLLLGALGVRAEEPLKYKVQLIWGADTERPEKAKEKFKDLEPHFRAKLGRLFKWKNYYQVDQQKVTVTPKSSKVTCMSHDCVVEIFDRGDENIEVHLYGEGKLVQRVRQDLPKGQYILIGGDVKKKENEAWIVAVCRAE